MTRYYLSHHYDWTLYHLYPQDPGRPSLNTPIVQRTTVEGHCLQWPPHRSVQAIPGPVQNGFGGILNKQQLVFSAADLPTGGASLSLVQEVPQLYTEGRASSYHFIHLTLQEYLAAVHISQLPACTWADKTSSKTSQWWPLQNDYEICS